MLFLLIQEAQQAEDGGGASPLPFWVPLVAMLAIFYFLLIRPQSKERRQQEAMRTALKKGDQVLTQAGILATIHQVKEKEIVLELEGGAKMRVVRDAIIRRLNADVDEPVSITAKKS
jgi:preprotein translocase subunit YajC